MFDRIASPLPSERWITSSLCAAALLAAIAVPACACDTPVYRYAMYNWEPGAYEVYYCYTSEPGDSDRAVNDTLAALAADDSAQTNVRFETVDVNDPAQLEALPEPVRYAIVEQRNTQPRHLVVSPHEGVLSAERLETDDVAALVDSPARRKLAEMLDLGYACVMVLLAGDDPAPAETAETEVREVIRMAADAEIVPDAIGGAPPREPESLDVGLLEVARNDPAERWLVRSLLGVESDLVDYAVPMVFTVYGRGRAMEPYVGPGITAEGLALDVAYVTGACSCEVKEASRGMDLPMRFDWEASAVRLAERIGEETGNEWVFSTSELLSAVVLASGGNEPPADPAHSAADRQGAATVPANERPTGAAAAARDAPANRRVTAEAIEIDADGFDDSEPRVESTIITRLLVAGALVAAVLAAITALYLRRT